MSYRLAPKTYSDKLLRKHTSRVKGLDLVLVLAKRSNLSLNQIIPLSTYASGRSLKFMRSEMSKRRCDIRYLAFLPFPLGGREIVIP